MAGNPKAKYPIQATKTTFEVIDALQELNGAGVSEIAEYTGMSKSSVHNYLSTLRELEFVEKDGTEYWIGLRFLSLGACARHQRQLYHVARAQVDDLAADTSELANLLVEEHGKGVYLYTKSGSEAVSVDVHTGHRIYLHNTAIGKAILAHMPEERVAVILDRHGLPRSTDRTITSRTELFQQLEEIQRTGIAFDRQERLKGLRCVAAPIFDPNGNVRGALSISGPVSRMSGDRFEKSLPNLLRNATNVIELDLAYS